MFPNDAGLEYEFWRPGRQHLVEVRNPGKIVAGHGLKVEFW